MGKGKKVFGIVMILLVAMLLTSCDFITKTIGDMVQPRIDTVASQVDGVASDVDTLAADTAANQPYKLPPIIATNTIGITITGLGYDLRGIDNFPSITLKAKVTDSDGNIITGLAEPDFFDAIDDNGKARPIYVTSPAAATTTGKMYADIVFVIDTTGSMGSYLTTMTSKAQAFADSLAASDVDYKIGYVTFGDDIRKGTHARLAPTSNVTTFKSEIGYLTASGGDDGEENQIDALDYARASVAEAATSNPWGSFQNDMGFTYRSGAKKVFILITDVGYHTPDSPGDVLSIQGKQVANTPEGEVSKLIADEVATFIVGPADETPVSYESIATATGGTFYSSGSDFAGIIDTLSGEITSLADYTILFMTDDFTASKLHTVRIAVHSSKGSGQATSTFTSPSSVSYTRALKRLNEQKALMLLKQ